MPGEFIKKESPDDIEKLYQLFNTMKIGVVFQDTSGKITSANPAAEKILGLTLDQMMGRTSMDPQWKSIHQDGSEFRGKNHPSMKALETGKPNFNTIMGVFHPEKNEYVWIEIDAVPIFKDSSDKPWCVYSSFNDITGRIKTEKALIESEEKFRSLCESTPVGVFFTDTNGEVQYLNRKCHEIIEMTFEERPLSEWINVIHPDDKEKEVGKFNECLRKELGYEGEVRFIMKSGQERCVYTTTSPVRSDSGTVIGYVGSSQDITRRKEIEKNLKASLKEKETLLKEIHHRVKNNIQIISSLINLQMKHIESRKDLELFQETQNRVYSMALVHEKLYLSDNLSEIDYSEYVNSIVTHLENIYSIDLTIIDKRIDIEDVVLDIDSIIPCALLINELVTNSFKYAFCDKNRGSLIIEMTQKESHYKLTIGDDGIGLPHDMDFRKGKSLGFQLVNALIKQLDATIELKKGRGTIFVIEFDRTF